METGSRKILVVDDEEQNRKMITSMLGYMGVDAEEAINGTEALIKAVKDRFDIIVMDLNMPIMGGLEATREIRAAGVDTIIIGFSGCGGSDVEKDCLLNGMDHFFEKPRGLCELLNFIRDRYG